MTVIIFPYWSCDCHLFYPSFGADVCYLVELDPLLASPVMTEPQTLAPQLVDRKGKLLTLRWKEVGLHVCGSVSFPDRSPAGAPVWSGNETVTQEWKVHKGLFGSVGKMCGTCMSCTCRCLLVAPRKVLKSKLP